MAEEATEEAMTALSRRAFLVGASSAAIAVTVKPLPRQWGVWNAVDWRPVKPHTLVQPDRSMMVLIDTMLRSDGRKFRDIEAFNDRPR